MITYTCPKDLEQFGFDCLTGEACGLSLRLLYDVNEQGKAILARTLGLDSALLTLPDSWNSKFTAGSVMLTNEMAQTCALFGMLYFARPACTEVWQVANEHNVVYSLIGWRPDDGDILEAFIRFRAENGDRNPGDSQLSHIRRFHSSRHPGTGDRNTHQMSGRTV